MLTQLEGHDLYMRCLLQREIVFLWEETITKQAVERQAVSHGEVNDGLLNMVEMAFRAYDPCHACATHSLPGQMPLIVQIRNTKGKVVREIKR